jgi:hypothetical protein
MRKYYMLSSKTVLLGVTYGGWEYQMSSILRVTMVGLYVCRKVKNNMKSIMLSMGDRTIGRKTESAMMNVLPVMF